MGRVVNSSTVLILKSKIYYTVKDTTDTIAGMQ